MDARATTKTFHLAPMSPIILIVMLVLLGLPVPIIISVGSSNLIIALAVTSVYAWIWLRFRPSSFVVRDKSLDIIWPLKRREILRDSISNIRLLDRDGLKQEIGWGVRIGAGGLGGAFGWLWTTRHGIVQMYVSRTDRFVWIERTHSRPWLVTPEQPDEFVRMLST
ncbi:MAG: PH domain-containing protein [Nitrospira sp.]